MKKLQKINKPFKLNKTVKTIILVLGIIAIASLGVWLLKITGWWDKINSVEKMKECVQSGGVFSFVIFIFFQILQTTILQIPAFVVTLVGALLFGKWQAFIMSYVAIVLGSIIMFWLGRKAGRGFLNWIAGKDSAKQWVEFLSGGKYLFFLMMLFPLFPDDILCVVAGLTNMSFSFFLWTNLITRGIGIAGTIFFGSGAIIPFSGWGLIVWGIIILFILILFYLSLKYKNEIDGIIKEIFKKSNKNGK